MSIPNPPATPSRRRSGDGLRWAAAREEYLAGATAEEVCRRHDIRLSTFRRHAQQDGWRRMDQPAPEPEPEPEPESLSAAPEASTHGETPTPPLSAAQMADKAWAMLQAAMAAGRLIEARGWLRLHKDLQAHVRAEQIAERRDRMDREEAERRAAESPRAWAAPPGQGREPEPAADLMAGPFPANVSSALAAELAALAAMAESARRNDEVRLQLDCFSPSESHTPGPAP